MYWIETQSKTKFTVDECDFESAMIIDENSEIGEMIKFGFCKCYGTYWIEHKIKGNSL